MIDVDFRSPIGFIKIESSKELLIARVRHSSMLIDNKNLSLSACKYVI
jgi:hypothetical protein